MKELSDRHRMFCDEYLANGMNGTRAYLKVYKSVKKEEVARAAAARLLTNVNVEAYIKSKQEEQSEKSLMTYEELVNKFLWIVKNAEEEGTPTKEGKVPDRSNMVSALKEVGKLLSHYPNEKLDVKMEQITPISFIELPKNKDE